METIQFKKTPHITIFHTKGKRDNYKQIYVCEEWSKGCDYFLIKEYYDKLIIKKCYLDIPNNAKKRSNPNNLLSYTSYIENGKYIADLQESDEDTLVFYLNKQNEQD